MTRNGLLLFAAVVIGVVYAGLIVALPSGSFFSGEEGIRWLQIDSLWRHRWTSPAIDPPGGALDPEAEFLPDLLVPVGGEARSVLAPTLPWLASVPYAMAGTRGIYLVPAAAALLCMAAAARLARWVVPPRWAVAAGAASVVATPLAFYGATIGDETLAAALCTAAMLPLASERMWHGFLAGLLLGGAGCARAECLLLIPAVVMAGAIAWGPRRFGFSAAGVAAGAAAIVVPGAMYHQAVFGSWLPPSLESTPSDVARSLAAEMLGPAAWRPWLLATLAATGLLFLVARVRRGSSTDESRSLLWVGAGAVLCLVLLVIGPLYTLLLELSPGQLTPQDRGYESLLSTLPILVLLPLAALPPPVPRRPHASFLGWTAALFIALTVAFAPVEAGPPWGPRRLLVAAPLITLALFSAVSARGKTGERALFVALVLGLMIQGVGLRFLVAGRTYNAVLIERVKTAVPAGDVILSDLPAVPQLLATLSPTRPTLYVRPESDREALMWRLEAAGVTPSWIVDQIPAGDDGVDLGAGLALVRDEQDMGVRGFLRAPRGD